MNLYNRYSLIDLENKLTVATGKDVWGDIGSLEWTCTFCYI